MKNGTSEIFHTAYCVILSIFFCYFVIPRYAERNFKKYLVVVVDVKNLTNGKEVSEFTLHFRAPLHWVRSSNFRTSETSHKHLTV